MIRDSTIINLSTNSVINGAEIDVESLLRKSSFLKKNAVQDEKNILCL